MRLAGAPNCLISEDGLPSSRAKRVLFLMGYYDRKPIRPRHAVLADRLAGGIQTGSAKFPTPRRRIPDFAGQARLVSDGVLRPQADPPAARRPGGSACGRN